MQKTSKLTKTARTAQTGGIAVKEKYGNVYFRRLARKRWGKSRSK